MNIDFYCGHDGLTLLFYDGNDYGYLQLMNTFNQLACNCGSEIVIHNISWIELVQPLELTAICKNCEEWQAGCVFRADGHVNSFMWINNSDGWSDTAALMRPVVAATTGCHQYLSNAPPASDVIVIVSKGESL